MPTQRILLVRLGCNRRHRLKHPQGVHLPFTLKYLQALLVRRGYSVRFVDCQAADCSLERLISRIIRWRPDLAVVSSAPMEREELAAVAAVVRQQCQGVAIAVGQDVSLDPAHYFNGSSPVDLAVPGEAEVACAEAVDRLRRGESLQKIEAAFQERLERRESILVDRPDHLPFPIYEESELARYPHAYPVPMWRRAVWGHILASRGCPYPCSFCTQMTRESYGARPRLRDPVKVVDEMEYLKGLGATVIAFDDDNLTTDAGFVKALCREIIRRKISLPWIAHARVDNPIPELAPFMKRAGCALLRFGIESASPRIIRKLRKGGISSSWRSITEQAIRAAHFEGIPTLGLFIIGNPTETEAEVLETSRFALELPLDFAQVHFFTPYIGSGAYETFREQIPPAVLAEQHHYRTPLVHFSGIPTRRLAELRTTFYRRFYGRPRWVIRHLKRYAGFYVANPQALWKLFNDRRIFLT